MYQIGEFSRLTELPVKTLRYYHEEGLLVPARVDGENGYRLYDDENLSRARVIRRLRELEFSLVDIRKILDFEADEFSFLDQLKKRKKELQDELHRLSEISKSIDQIILFESKVKQEMSQSEFKIEEKTIDDLLVCSVRMKGKYSDCGKVFPKLGRKFGRYVNGAPMLLHHDTEYREDDADFEVCMPIAKGKSSGEIEVRSLAGGRCICLLHKGPYETLSRSYERIMNYVKENQYSVTTPTREVYVKGPGIIFKGNPENYVTEIQMLVE